MPHAPENVTEFVRDDNCAGTRKYDLCRLLRELSVAFFPVVKILEIWKSMWHTARSKAPGYQLPRILTTCRPRLWLGETTHGAQVLAVGGHLIWRGPSYQKLEPRACLRCQNPN